jgi:hypothetical protein
VWSGEGHERNHIQTHRVVHTAHPSRNKVSFHSQRRLANPDAIPPTDPLLINGNRFTSVGTAPGANICRYEAVPENDTVLDTRDPSADCDSDGLNLSGECATASMGDGRARCTSTGRCAVSLGMTIDRLRVGVAGPALCCDALSNERALRRGGARPVYDALER